MKKNVCGICGALFLILITLFVIQKKREESPHLLIYGPVKPSNSLTKQTANIIHALKKEMKIECIATEKIMEKIPRDIRLALKETIPKSKVHFFEAALWHPCSSHCFTKYIKNMPSNSLRIAYSTFETSKIPQEWVLILNCFFDAIAVPDKFLIDVYKNSGVQTPIFEVPLGINLEQFLNEPLKTKKNKSVITFANFANCTDQNNQLTLIKAFAKAFGNRDDVLLKINSREYNPSIKNLIEYEIKSLGLDNVVFTNFILRDENYLRFFQTIDCYVSCSKGESFAIEPREAMALGIPVILTTNTAQSTLCESGLIKTVPSDIQELAQLESFEIGTCGYFSNCKVDDLADALLDVFNHYDNYLQKGSSAREWAKQYRFKNISKSFLNLIKPKKVLFGDKNGITNEYLMTNSEELYKKYQSLSRS